MHNRIGILSAAAVAAAAAALMMAPAASAATATPEVTAFTTCASGSVVADFGADVYSGPDSFTVLTTVSAGPTPLACENGIALGRRYTACGESNGNGWIRLMLGNGVIGYSPQACFSDA